MPDAPALDPARLPPMGLMIADRQAGRFRLAIRSMAPAHASEPAGGDDE